jgi:hypothetical protein
MVLRRLQETQAQIRNPQHVRELKALYRNACTFCGKQTVIGVDPSRHYSEASQYKTNIIWHKLRKDGGSDGRGVGFYFPHIARAQFGPMIPEALCYCWYRSILWSP